MLMPGIALFILATCRFRRWWIYHVRNALWDFMFFIYCRVVSYIWKCWREEEKCAEPLVPTDSKTDEGIFSTISRRLLRANEEEAASRSICMRIIAIRLRFSLIGSASCAPQLRERSREQYTGRYLCLGVVRTSVISPGCISLSTRVWVSTPPSNVSLAQRLAEKNRTGALLSVERYN